MYGNTQQSVLSLCNRQINLNWTYVLKTVHFTLNKHSLMHSIIPHWWLVKLAGIFIFVFVCHQEHCCNTALETKSLLPIVRISTGEILPYGTDCRVTGCTYLEWLPDNSWPDKQRMSAHFSTSSPALQSTTLVFCQFDSDNKHLLTVLTALFMAMIFCAASSLPFSSGVCLFLMSF